MSPWMPKPGSRDRMKAERSDADGRRGGGDVPEAGPGRGRAETRSGGGAKAPGRERARRAGLEGQLPPSQGAAAPHPAPAAGRALRGVTQRSRTLAVDSEC